MFYKGSRLDVYEYSLYIYAMADKTTPWKVIDSRRASGAMAVSSYRYVYTQEYIPIHIYIHSRRVCILQHIFIVVRVGAYMYENQHLGIDENIFRAEIYGAQRIYVTFYCISSLSICM